MKCEDPVLCYTNGTTKIFRNFSAAPPTLKILSQLIFDCGKCLPCRKKKATELAMRCVLHASLYLQNSFITLTYDETKDGYHNRFQYSDIQKFKKRLRSYCRYHGNKRIQIFNVHEYGANGKKHWHLVCFNHDFADKRLFTTKNGNRIYTSQTLEELWPHGFNTIADVTEASAMYQAQYTQKDFKYGNIHENKSHSKHSGIGRDYFLAHYKQILSLGYIPFDSRKVPIPRYFQKLAHRHYSHFYQPENFEDTTQRKKIHRPFKKTCQANEQMANLYLKYNDQKQQRIEELKLEWEQYIQEKAFSHEMAHFQQSGQNLLYDLRNKLNQHKF